MSKRDSRKLPTANGRNDAWNIQPKKSGSPSHDEYLRNHPLYSKIGIGPMGSFSSSSSEKKERNRSTSQLQQEEEQEQVQDELFYEDGAEKKRFMHLFSKYHKTKKRNDMLEANALALQEELRKVREQYESLRSSNDTLKEEHEQLREQHDFITGASKVKIEKLQEENSLLKQKEEDLTEMKDRALEASHRAQETASAAQAAVERVHAHAFGAGASANAGLSSPQFGSGPLTTEMLRVLLAAIEEAALSSREIRRNKSVLMDTLRKAVDSENSLEDVTNLCSQLCIALSSELRAESRISQSGATMNQLRAGQADRTRKSAAKKNGTRNSKSLRQSNAFHEEKRRPMNLESYDFTEHSKGLPSYALAARQKLLF